MLRPNHRSEVESKSGCEIKLLFRLLYYLWTDLWLLLQDLPYLFYGDRVLGFDYVTWINSLSLGWKILRSLDTSREPGRVIKSDFFVGISKGVFLYWFFEVILLYISEFIIHLFDLFLQNKPLPDLSLYLFSVLVFNELLLFVQILLLSFKFFLEFSLEIEIVLIFEFLHFLFLSHYLDSFSFDLIFELLFLFCELLILPFPSVCLFPTSICILESLYLFQITFILH